jgi:D-alanyl-lipoteichoic acid acyltransferase DltB (MBOAT superfamily)
LFIHAPAVLLYLLESSFAHLQLGVSRAFGIVGTENFDRPFLARDPRDVWHRWNITLSTWLRDYVYIPLGGNRCHKYRNILLVFIYVSLLHGLQPRCLAWGLWTGGTLALYQWLRDRYRARKRPTSTLRPTSTFRFILITLARLATFHWFAIGVTIILDPDYCGARLLRQYVTLLLRAVTAG